MAATTLADGIRFNATSTGTGDFVDASAVTGYRRGASNLIDGKTYRYRAENASLSEYERGYGVWNNSTSTLARTTIDYSSTGSKVAFSTAPQVGITPAPDDISAWDPGDAKLTFRTTANSGWFLCDDGSIGDASSGATTRANADTADCFAVLYNITTLIVQDSAGATVARGASAAADYAAHRRLVIPKTLGRAIAIAGSGSGLTARALGTTAGSETETPTLAKTASHQHVVSTAGIASAPPNNSALTIAGAASTASGLTGTGSTDVQGSGTPLNIVQPEFFMNIAIKL